VLVVRSTAEMVRLCRYLGALVGFAIPVIFTEWLYTDTFVHRETLEVVIVSASAVTGAFAGSSLGHRFVNRRHARPA
jgi:hypothetical protein